MTINFQRIKKILQNPLKRRLVAGLKNFRNVVYLLSSWLIFAAG